MHISFAALDNCPPLTANSHTNGHQTNNKNHSFDHDGTSTRIERTFLGLIFLDDFTDNDGNSCVILDDNSKGDEISAESLNYNDEEPLAALDDDDDDSQCIDMIDP